MVLASSIYNIIYIYINRVYVDSHSLGQLALASKRTASYVKLCATISTIEPALSLIVLN